MRWISVAALLALPAASSAVPVAGTWEGPLGVVRIEGGGGSVSGKLVVPRPGVALAEGAPVVRGAELGDSLSAEVRLPLSGCKKRDAWAGGVLLLAMKGNLLSGALNVAEEGCAPRALGPNGGFAMRRIPDEDADAAIAEARAAHEAIARAAAAEKPAEPRTAAGTPEPKTPAEATAAQAPEAKAKPPIAAKGGVAAGKKVRVALAPRVKDDAADEARMGDEAVWAANQDLRPLGELERREVDDPGVRQLRRAAAQAVMRDAQNYMTEGRFEQARQRFLDAIEKDPTVSEAYNGVGVTYYARNQHGEALDWYKRALAVDPDLGDAYYNIACLHAVKGEKEAAFRFLTLAVRNGYTTDEALDDDHDLDALRADPRFAKLKKAGAAKRKK